MYIDIQRGLQEVLKLNRRQPLDPERKILSDDEQEIRANYEPILNPTNNINRNICHRNEP